MLIDAGETSFDFTLTTSLKPNPLTVSVGGATTTINFPAVTTAYSEPEEVIISGDTYTVDGGSVIIGPATLHIPQAASTTRIVAVGDFLVTVQPTAVISDEFYTLPTTVVTLNGVTQPFPRLNSPT